MTLANWRDLAAVLLAVEAFIMGLVPAALLFFAVKGMLWVIHKLRSTAPLVQGYFRTGASVTGQVSRRIVTPVIAVSAGATQVRRMASHLSWSPRISREV